MEKKIRTIFFEKFGGEPIIVKSPGRVNIIGEHTDYNDGFVLPAAIDKAVYVALSKREDDLIRLYAEDFKELFESRIDELKPYNHHWSNYILGVVDQLQKNGHVITGFNLVIDGDIPIGAGLSSSAAVECAVVFAMNELFRLQIPKMEMVKIAQQAEHIFAGVKCGIMDQFASMMGQKNNAIKLDCKSLDYEYLPLDLRGYKIVLFNTNVKHSLATSQYNVRREQCEQGVKWVRKHQGEITSLRDVTMEMLNKFVLPQSKLVYTRCKYVVEEKLRLLYACSCIKNGDLDALGKKMFETHEGLRKDYEVSCKELDFLVNEVKNTSAVIGARMVGGGFGGCTINLMKEDAIAELSTTISRNYEREMNLPLTVYVAEIENGTSLVNSKEKG